MILNEYEDAANILDYICKLGFKVVESPAPEDFEDDSPFTLVDAAGEGMLSMSISDIGADLVTAYVKLAQRCDGLKLAKKLVDIFEQPICKKNNPSMLVGEELHDDLFSHMMNILEAEILEAETNLTKMFSKIVFSHKKFLYEKKLERKKEILLNIKYKCIEQPQNNYQQKGSVLAALWEQIKELIGVLEYERYIDDHDYYGCYDPMLNLSNKLCFKADEFLGFAYILDNSSYYEKEAAYLYHKYGRDNKYVSYLETHLEKESKTYTALMNYYKDHDNFDRTRWVAEQALEKCKDDLTDFFIYLLNDAEKRKDKAATRNCIAVQREGVTWILLVLIMH